MSLLRVLFTNPNVDSQTSNRDNFQPGRHQEALRLSRIFQNLASGHSSGCTLKVSNLSGQTQATGTVTCASVSAADTVTIGNIVFTAEASGATGNQFNVGGTDTITATNLAAAINANATLSKFLVATSALGVVTLTCTNLGALGNLLQLSSSNNTRLAVVGFASGVDASETTYTS